MKKTILTFLSMALLAGQLIGGTATFSWDYDYTGQDPATISFQVYKVDQDTQDASVLAVIGNAPTLSYTDNNVDPGTVYTYAVTALQTIDQTVVESDYSNLIVVSLLPDSVIRTAKLNKNKVTLTWDDLGANVVYTISHAITLAGQPLNTNFVDFASTTELSGSYDISALNKSDVISLKLTSNNGSTTSESSVLNIVYNPPTNLVNQ